MRDEASEELVHGTWDIFEWLRELHEQGELRNDFHPLPMVLPYHAPCQQRAHRIGKPALEILDLIPQLDLRESHARCCGIAGTYGYKTEKYQIAMDVGEELFSFVREQGPDLEYTACDSETCRWQLEHGTDIASRHPIEFLAAAYGLYDLDKRALL
jgi:glycerol-3-phosphate dehydrogenase subunit C